jgi:hypothetical protein
VLQLYPEDGGRIFLRNLVPIKLHGVILQKIVCTVAAIRVSHLAHRRQALFFSAKGTPKGEGGAARLQPPNPSKLKIKKKPIL